MNQIQFIEVLGLRGQKILVALGKIESVEPLVKRFFWIKYGKPGTIITLESGREINSQEPLESIENVLVEQVK